MADLRSEMVKKPGKPVAAPVPAYFDSGEERFLGDVLYSRKPEQKLNYYAAGQPGTGRGLLPMYGLTGKLIGGPKPLPKNLNTACPVDESEPRPSYFLKAECKLHGEKNEETVKIKPCKPEELPAACRKTAENLKLKPVSAETKHVGFHDDHCTEEENDCCRLHRELPDREEVITQGKPSDSSVCEKPKQVCFGMGFASKHSRDSEKPSLYPEPKHLSTLGAWKAAQNAKECLVQHYYHAISKNGEYVFVKKLWKGNLPNEQRRKAAGLPLLGGSSIWSEKWPTGPKGTATRRAPLGKLYAAALDALTHHNVNGESKVLDSTYKSLAQSDVAGWCRLNAVQVALFTPHKVIRDSRDGNYEQQRTFEGITKEPLFVSKAGKLHSVKSKTGYKHVDRASKPKVDAWEYVNRQPALTLSKLAGELDWFEAERLTTKEVRKEYLNHFDYSAKAKHAAEIRERLEQREFRCVYDRSAQQWIPRIGPNTEEEAQEWDSDKHIYTTWVLKTNKSRLHEHRFAFGFAVKINEMRQRIQASRELAAENVLLDPLRPINNVLTEWAADTEHKKKRMKTYLPCIFFANAGKVFFPDFPRELIEHNRERGRIAALCAKSIEITFPTSARCKSGANLHEASTVRDLNLKAIMRDDLNFTIVIMAYRMGAFYNVKEGAWQPCREGWQPVGVPAQQLQRTRLEQLFRGDLECIEDAPFGWTVPTVELKSNSFDPNGWLEYVKAKELHNVHFKPTVELAKGNESCTCWHCGETFLTYYSLQTHVDKHYTCKTFEEFYCTLLNKDGTAPMRHEHYGAVKFLRVLPSDGSRAWVRKNGGNIGVDINTLRFKNGEELKGSEMFKKLTTKPYEPSQEPSRIVTMSEDQEETLHNYLCVAYPRDRVKALRDFRGYRREQGYKLLTENTYQFLDAIEERMVKGEELSIKVVKDTAEEGVRWQFKMGLILLYLGVIGSPTRKDVPGKNEVLEHCMAKARETQDNAKLTAEWAAWVIKAHVCRLDGCTWYEGGDDVLSKGPASNQPTTSFLAKLSITDAEPRGTLPEEEDATE